MIRGFLSPTSKHNSQNWFPTSPTNKSLGSPVLDDSFNSLNYSQLLHSQTINPRYNSFKKLKAERIKQKNQQGKIIKQLIFKNKSNYRLHALDDVKTIESHNSQRSSVSMGKHVVEQSIIIMSGKELQKMTKEQKQQFLNQPQTPCFKRRNTHNQDAVKRRDFLKPISINPPLLKSIQTGLLFNYEIVKRAPQDFKYLSNIRLECVLQIYSVIPIKSCANQLTMIIYEPYTQSLNEYILKLETVFYRQLINYMIEIVKILTHLRNLYIYPSIEPTSVVMTNTTIKIKLRSEQNESNQRSTIRQCGYYFSSILKSLTSCGSSSRKQRRMIDLTINRRIKLQNLMQQFIRMEDYTLDEAYLKLQTIEL